MQVPDVALLLAPEEPLGQRLGVLAVCLLLGAYLIWVGRYNVRARRAEESGERAALLSMFGKSTVFEGRKAVWMGWMRIVLGIAAIGFGIAFLFFGAFLKK